MGSPLAQEARAVLLVSTATRNTSAPTDPQEAAAWNLQARWGGFLATPIGSQYFIAAKHVATSSQVVLGSVAYDLDTSFNGVGYVTDPGSDLLIGKITGTFSRYADLYNTTTDGGEQYQEALIFGRGTQRGTPVYVSGALRGWQWGAGDGVQSWGKNVISGYANYNASFPNSLLYFNFDRVNSTHYISNEGALSVGDSSGGVFIQGVDGEWKLAGINYAVDGPFSYTGTGPESGGFNASVFDAGGLYVWNGSGWSFLQDQAGDIQGSSYASLISNRLGWITGQLPSLYWAPAASGGGTGIWSSTSNNWASLAGFQGSGSQAGTGVLVFSGTAGTITVGQSGAPTITVAKGMTFEVDGYSLVAGAADSKIVLGGAATDNVITVTNSGHTATLGVRLDGVAGLIKDGAGRLVLNGANTYTGVTRVAHGTLELGSPAVANVIGAYNSTSQTLSGGNGVDIQHGTLVIDYTGASPEPGIAKVLKEAYAHSFASGFGSIYSTTANAAGRALGWNDNETSVTVMYTLFGDANLDGTVNFDDVNKVLTGYNQAGAWAAGDFTYDGLVNFDDLNKALNAYNTSLGASETISGAALDAQAVNNFTVVPEPSSVVLLLSGLTGLVAYGWRKRR